MDNVPAAASSGEVMEKALLVRIIAKAPLSVQYNASKGNVFHTIAISTEYGTVYLAAYGADADHFYAKLEEKKMYQIASAHKEPILEDKRFQYSDRLNCRFVLKAHTTLWEIKNDNAMQFAIPKSIRYNPTAYTQMPPYSETDSKQTVDVIGVYNHSDSEAVEHTRADDGTVTHKRTVLIEVDHGDGGPDVELSLVLWGEHAQAFRPPEGDRKHFIGLKNVRVNAAGGGRIVLWSTERTTIQWDVHATRGN